MEISAQVKLHTIAPDTLPFALFGIEVFTEFSRHVITKRYTDFYRFHKDLCYFAHLQFSPERCLMDVIPKLPGSHLTKKPVSDNLVSVRKQELNTYVKGLTALHNCTKDTSTPWFQMIRDFFKLEEIETKQEKSAKLIQRSFKKYTEYLWFRKNTQKKYENKGYVTKLDEFPDELLVEIFSFMKLEELWSIACANKRLNRLTKKPILWTTLNLFPNKYVLSPLQFKSICKRAWCLTWLDLRYCSYINSDSLVSVAKYCNPQSLRYLLLDGCEQVDDGALVSLTEKFDEPTGKLKGGARGLKRLSLAECRHITDQGVSVLRKLKQLEDLNLLGCYSVTDEGLKVLFKKSTKFHKLNLSGTYISREGLTEIKNNCSKLEMLLLNGCRLLSLEDKNLFTNVEVELREDVFRFQLLPDPNCSLSPITNNILRTRSSLTIQRVSHYIQRKLEKTEEIHILCKGIVLSPYMTLKEVQNDLWDNSMLSLFYRLKTDTLLLLENESNNWVGLPKWVSDNDALECQICSERFWLLLRRHHCRKCGRVVCDDCSKQKSYLADLGYTRKPVRVCDKCKVTL